MGKLLKYIGIVIFIGWAIALLVNFPIYQYTTSQGTFIHPIVDGILFMAVMLGIYFFIMALYKKKQANASIALIIIGAFSVLLAVFYFINGI